VNGFSVADANGESPMDTAKAELIVAKIIGFLFVMLFTLNIQ